jgi:membrane associated rhomboid family serine protease
MITLFTSLFLHVSVTHLLWNVAFLWLFGPSCEDALGHGAYVVFYVIGGIVAGLLHTAIVLLFAQNSAASFAPLVGASGAISALVGMYALRYYRSKLRFVWLCASFLGLRTARFSAPAIFGLGLWFLQNLFGAIYALIQPDREGIAYWAHIGGFLFGMTVAEITGMLGEGMREYLFADAVTAQDRGEEGVRIAITKFRLLLQKKPDDDDVREALAGIAENSEAMDNLSVQQAVGEAYAMLLDQAFGLVDHNHIKEWQCAFDDMCAEDIVGEDCLFSIADKAAQSGYPHVAVRLFTKLISRFPVSRLSQHAKLALAVLLIDESNGNDVKPQVVLPLLGAAATANSRSEKTETFSNSGMRFFS